MVAGSGRLLPVALFAPGVDLSGADLAAVEVHRAGEPVTALGHVAAADHVDHADHEVIAAGLVVDAGVQEFHSTPTEAVLGLPADRILTDVDGLLGGEAAGRTIGTAVAVRRAIVAAGSGVVGAGSAVGGIAVGSAAGVVAAAPNEVEGIAFGHALGIFNADDGATATARF